MENITIIIPTNNSGSTIDQCLLSIKKQTYPHIETIIVDNQSKDKTIDIATNYNTKIIIDCSLRSKARNIALKESIGDYILSIDSDMNLADTVVEECIKKSKKFDALIIPEISYGKGFWAECRSLEKRCYIGDDSIEAPRFFSKKILQNIGGYDPRLEFGEDWDLHQRLKIAGFKVGRINSLIMHNEGNLKLIKIIKKKYYYGKSIDQYKRKYPKEFAKQSKFIRPAFIKNWRLLIKSPIISLGIFIMKSCEFSSIGMGNLINLMGREKR